MQLQDKILVWKPGFQAVSCDTEFIERNNFILLQCINSQIPHVPEQSLCKQTFYWKLNRRQKNRATLLQLLLLLMWYLINCSPTAMLKAISICDSLTHFFSPLQTHLIMPPILLNWNWYRTHYVACDSSTKLLSLFSSSRYHWVSVEWGGLCLLGRWNPKKTSFWKKGKLNLLICSNFFLVVSK